MIQAVRGGATLEAGVAGAAVSGLVLRGKKRRNTVPQAGLLRTAIVE
jgi:hypothetical protein